MLTSRCCLRGRDLGGGEGEPPEALNEDRAEQRNTHIGMPAGHPDKWMCGEHGDETSHQLLPFQGCWGSVDELTKSVALKNITQALIPRSTFLVSCGRPVGPYFYAFTHDMPLASEAFCHLGKSCHSPGSHIIVTSSVKPSRGLLGSVKTICQFCPKAVERKFWGGRGRSWSEKQSGEWNDIYSPLALGCLLTILLIALTTLSVGWLYN